MATKRITDTATAGLQGPVKQMVLARYKAHLQAGSIIRGKLQVDSAYDHHNVVYTFSEQGKKIHEHLFGSTITQKNTYNEAGQMVDSQHCQKDGTVFMHSTYTYNEKGQLLEMVSLGAGGKRTSRFVHTYTPSGKPLENRHYRGEEEQLYEMVKYTYDEKENMLSSIRSDKDGTIKHETHCKYNAQGKQEEYISRFTDAKMARNYTHHIHKYNAQGDCIETTSYHPDGSIKDVYQYTHTYDSEGKKIVPPPSPPPPQQKNAPAETEQCEYDAHGNWVKKTTFHNKVPAHIFIREFTYYGEPDRTLSHPFSNAAVVAEEVEDTGNYREPLEPGQAQWLAETANGTVENFPLLRYYALTFRDAPSVIQYSGPHIEAYALLHELKEHLHARMVHSHSIVWNNGRPRLQRYTVEFRNHPGYLLYAMSISAHNADEFDVPDSIESDDYDRVYLSVFQLLHPGDASGRRDTYFEEDLAHYIELCSLKKKPEKPMIHLIEVRNNTFAMVEHAVDDDFEIKDLDINYGYGFSKFHNELMHRFHTSTKGLVLFHGQPGTGKTFYIRHLLRQMAASKKVVIYLPPNMVDHLVDPMFMTFLTREVQSFSADGNFCVLLIEDAEPLLARRQEGVRIQGITNLLNMSDGLLNDMLNLQIICTFNVDLRKLDNALLRPGRLIARKEFKALSELDANLLAQRLGLKHHFKGPATLGEIYAMRKHHNILIHDVEPDKNASTELDDIL